MESPHWGGRHGTTYPSVSCSRAWPTSCGACSRTPRRPASCCRAAVAPRATTCCARRPRTHIEPSEVTADLDTFERAPRSPLVRRRLPRRLRGRAHLDTRPLGQDYEVSLPAGSDPLPLEGEGEGGGAHAANSDPVPIHSPSHPGADPIGTVTFASAETAQRTPPSSVQGAATWAESPVEERAAVLRRAAGSARRSARTSSPPGSSTRAAATAPAPGPRSSRPSTTFATTPSRRRRCSRRSATASPLEAWSR